MTDALSFGIVPVFFGPVQSSNCVQEEPCTPEGRAITGAIENNANRTPPSALAALLISPGSLPAKRLYSDVWKEPPPAGQAPHPRSNNRLSFSRFGIFLVQPVGLTSCLAPLLCKDIHQLVAVFTNLIEEVAAFISL